MILWLIATTAVTFVVTFVLAAYATVKATLDRYDYYACYLLLLLPGNFGIRNFNCKLLRSTPRGIILHVHKCICTWGKHTYAVSIYIYIYIYIYVCVCVSMYLYIYIYICIHVMCIWMFDDEIHCVICIYASYICTHRNIIHHTANSKHSVQHLLVITCLASYFC